ncbi:MAG: MltR family transcriptional regulator [Desulfobaccales bacterium]
MPEINSTRIQAVVDKLREEQSDRACAILGVATLEALLENLLRRWMLPDAPEELFKSVGPLATFSARIDIAYAFGLISPLERRDLHLLRKIRNDFAHDFDHELVFTNLAVGNRVKALSLPALIEDLPDFQESSPRYRFYVGVSLLFLVLSDLRIRTAKSPPVPKELYRPVT